MEPDQKEIQIRLEHWFQSLLKSRDQLMANGKLQASLKAEIALQEVSLAALRARVVAANQEEELMRGELTLFQYQVFLADEIRQSIEDAQNIWGVTLIDPNPQPHPASEFIEPGIEVSDEQLNDRIFLIQERIQWMREYYQEHDWDCGGRGEMAALEAELVGLVQQREVFMDKIENKSRIGDSLSQEQDAIRERFERLLNERAQFVLDISFLKSLKKEIQKCEEALVVLRIEVAQAEKKQQAMIEKLTPFQYLNQLDILIFQEIEEARRLDLELIDPDPCFHIACVPLKPIVYEEGKEMKDLVGCQLQERLEAIAERSQWIMETYEGDDWCCGGGDDEIENLDREKAQLQECLAALQAAKHGETSSEESV